MVPLALGTPADLCATTTVPVDKTDSYKEKKNCLRVAVSGTMLILTVSSAYRHQCARTTVMQAVHLQMTRQ